MKIIKIETSAGKKYQASFDTQEELDLWKSSQLAKGLWSESDVTYNGDLEEDYKVKRLEEYLKIQNLLAEALVEKELGDDSKFQEYMVLRNAIKQQYPKPE